MLVLTNVFFCKKKNKYELIEVYSIQVHSKATGAKAELNENNKISLFCALP